VTVELPIMPMATALQHILGSNRLLLTTQSPVIQAVIQDSFEHVRAALLFRHAFPGVGLAVSFIRKALITAAAMYGPEAEAIHTRLMDDTEYVLKIVPLVRIFCFEDDITDVI
jgi:hypothetical protein